MFYQLNYTPIVLLLHCLMAPPNGIEPSSPTFQAGANPSQLQGRWKPLKSLFI